MLSSNLITTDFENDNKIKDMINKAIKGGDKCLYYVFAWPWKDLNQVYSQSQ